ncbi:MAG: helix-turn-helix transcriptional regulator [Gammaproteobacteria bacterium]|nr:helix-turn-helix transcriptional regulator [Gammaproteobacteria bacterium]
MAVQMPTSHLASLIEQIILAAKAKGLDQKRLLEKAGLGASTLSKIKQAGDVRFSTLERLANVVNLRISLSSNDPVLEKLMDRNFFSPED